MWAAPSREEDPPAVGSAIPWAEVLGWVRTPGLSSLCFLRMRCGRLLPHALGTTTSPPRWTVRSDSESEEALPSLRCFCLS